MNIFPKQIHRVGDDYNFIKCGVKNKMCFDLPSGSCQVGFHQVFSSTLPPYQSGWVVCTRKKWYGSPAKYFRSVLAKTAKFFHFVFGKFLKIPPFFDGVRSKKKCSGLWLSVTCNFFSFRIHIRLSCFKMSGPFMTCWCDSDVCFTLNLGMVRPPMSSPILYIFKGSGIHVFWHQSQCNERHTLSPLPVIGRREHCHCVLTPHSGGQCPSGVFLLCAFLFSFAELHPTDICGSK